MPPRNRSAAPARYKPQGSKARTVARSSRAQAHFDARGDAILWLRPGKERSLQRRHPWVYASAVAHLEGQAQPGETVAVCSADGEFLSWAAYSANSAIAARGWTYVHAERPDAELLAARVRAAVLRRADLPTRTNAIRLVFGEADELPGFVADRYAEQLVVQFLSAGAEYWRDTLVSALVAASGCGHVYERSDAAAREREGLVVREGPLLGDPPDGPVNVTEDGVHYSVDVQQGHKTGFYIDQRDNRALIANLAAGRQVLNCFCYTGGFSLAALKAGASSVLSIDSSEPALEQARRNQALNGLDPAGALAGRECEWRNANVFDALKALAAEDRRFDLVVLDPPKFAPSAHHLDRAARAYKEINLKALRLLAPDGILATFSCSGAVSIDLWQKIVAGAVIDAGVGMQFVQRLSAGADHPMLMTHPEGEYLKGLLLRRI